MSNSIAELHQSRLEWLERLELLQRLVAASVEAEIGVDWLAPYVAQAVEGLQITADMLNALTAQGVSNG